jgi:transposase-like protein
MSTKRRHTQAERDAATTLFATGHTPHAAAKRMGIHRRTAKDWWIRWAQTATPAQVEASTPRPWVRREKVLMKPSRFEAIDRFVYGRAA